MVSGFEWVIIWSLAYAFLVATQWGRYDGAASFDREMARRYRNLSMVGWWLASTLLALVVWLLVLIKMKAST